jgi:hypothetical protein
MIPDSLKSYDYRTNLICDPNNPVLIQKAWRDRFSDASHWRAGYGGTAYLSRPNGEDALTWNVFRTLQCAGEGGLAAIAEFFGLSSVSHLLFWGADVHTNSELQQLVSILIRTVDGRLGGTMTEADLVIVAEREVVFCECKLNNNGGSSPWMAKGDGAEKRMGVYKEHLPEIGDVPDWRSTYQLVRQYVYARKLALALDKEQLVIPLINQVHCENLQRFYSPLQSVLGSVFRPLATWQGMKSFLGASSLPVAVEIVRKLDEALAAAR